MAKSRWRVWRRQRGEQTREDAGNDRDDDGLVREGEREEKKTSLKSAATYYLVELQQVRRSGQGKNQSGQRRVVTNAAFAVPWRQVSLVKYGRRVGLRFHSG